ncbi:MAG: hypothetical protein LJF30_17925 [Acidobacteria bacterium]|nr:hypothetical protein [Acidobacteriota bacterium]
MTNVLRWMGVLVVAVAGVLVAPGPARAQGCVCQKQGGPVFGGVGPYIETGSWQLLLFYRGYQSEEHFRGRERFIELDANGPRNQQQLTVASLTWAPSTRLNLSLSVPVFSNDFDVRRQPPGGGERVWVPIGASGLGDINVQGRYWILDPNGPHAGGHNIGVSLGVKLPTGRSDRTDEYFGRQVPVDVSIQTGDGHWGGLTKLHAFQNAGPATLFATGTYLFVPGDTTEVPTFFGSLNNPNNTTYNSAADQFSVQMGGSVTIIDKWLIPSLAFRVEGVPVSDLFGASDGFRRPGVIGFVEPGLNFVFGRHLIGVNLAIRSYVNIRDSPTSTRVEDATVPKYMVTAGYSVRF